MVDRFRLMLLPEGRKRPMAGFAYSNPKAAWNMMALVRAMGGVKGTMWLRKEKARRR